MDLGSGEGSTGLTSRGRQRDAANTLPDLDGPVDEVVQEEVLEGFKRQQDAQEKLFSHILVMISCPLSCFFIFHAYYHLRNPWPFPFDGLLGVDKLGTALASLAHVCTGLSVASSFLSTIANVTVRAYRKQLLTQAIAFGVVAWLLWLRIFLGAQTFPGPYLAFISGILIGPIFVQWYIFSTWEETRREIQRLSDLRYKMLSA